MTKDIFSRVAEARTQTGGGGNRYRDGKYEGTVLKLTFEHKNSGDCFIAEHLVDTAERVYEDIEPNRPGTTASIVINFDGPGKLAAPRNVADYFAGLLGPKVPSLTEGEYKALLEKVSGPDQPCKGMRVRHETFRKLTRTGENSKMDDDGRPKFLAQKWSHVPANTDDATVAARRAELEMKGL